MSAFRGRYRDREALFTHKPYIITVRLFSRSPGVIINFSTKNALLSGQIFPAIPSLSFLLPPLRSFTMRRYSRFSRSFFSIAVRQLHRQLPRRCNERIEEYHGRGYPLGDNGNWSEMKSFNFLRYTSLNDGSWIRGEKDRYEVMNRSATRGH